MFYLIQALYFILPAASVVFFAVSLVRFLTARRKNKRIPGTFSEQQMKNRQICLVISSVIAGLFVLVIAAFAVLLFMAIAFM